MKIATFSVVGLILAAGCSSPEPQTQSAPSHSQAQIDLSQPKFVYVAGEVRIPGKVAWTNGMTLEDTLKAAGGFTDFARHRLRVNHPDGSVNIYNFDSKMHLTNNPPVLPGDLIYNPRRGIF
jgi:protein involved in polysaccharide export with SLBB domain